MVLLVLGAWFIVLGVFARAFARLLPVNRFVKAGPGEHHGRGSERRSGHGRAGRRVDLERMREASQRERAALARGAAAERTRVVRAGRLNRDCHMVGRVGRFQLPLPVT